MVRQLVHMDNPADVVALLHRLPAAFPDALVELMKWRGYTVEDLAESALTSPKMIQRLRTDKTLSPDVDVFMQLSIGLRMPPAVLQSMMQRAGRGFLPIEKHVVYQELQPEAYRQGLSMFQFNSALAEYGIAPIGQFD